MGKRGPARTPTVMLAARGSPKAVERQADGEPQVEASSPPMPDGLTDAAKSHWDFIVPKLIARRTLSEADVGMLTIMCVEWAEYMLAVSDLAKLRATRKSYKGHMIDHPRVRMKGSYDRYNQTAKQFGLSPASKSSVSASPEKTKDNGKGRFFGGPRLASTA